LTTRGLNIPVILYGFETWSVTLRERPRLLKTFENKVLKRIHGAKSEEVADDGETWIMLSKERLLFTYTIVRVIKSRRMRWVGHVERMDGMKNVYKILVGELEGK
jgi:hypothetical protein